MSDISEINFFINWLNSPIEVEDFLLSKKIIKSISDAKFKSLTPILPNPNTK